MFFILALQQAWINKKQHCCEESCLSLIGWLGRQKWCRPTVLLPAEACLAWFLTFSFLFFFPVIFRIKHQWPLHCGQCHSKQYIGNGEPGSIKLSDSLDPSRPAGRIITAVPWTVIYLLCHGKSSDPCWTSLVQRKGFTSPSVGCSDALASVPEQWEHCDPNTCTLFTSSLPYPSGYQECDNDTWCLSGVKNCWWLN